MTEKQIPTTDKYKCNMCNKTFSDRRYYYKHINLSKPCVSKEKVVELVQRSNMQESKLQSLEEQTKEQQDQIQQLKEQLLIFQTQTDIKLFLKDEIVSDIVNKIDESNENKRFHCAQNQYILNNHTSNNKIDVNIDQRTGNFFDIELSQDRKERLDHLTGKIMMKVLSAESFPKSMAKLVASIYFHPKVPENHKWCVSDTTMTNGALQYSSETGTLYRANTHDVICKNVQNILFGVTDILTELSQTNAFSETQAINCNRIVNLVGNELNDLCVKEIKDTAYKHRQFTKAAWNYMNIPIDTTFVSAQQKLSQI